jgi:Protein of unknown function (DUF3300)
VPYYEPAVVYGSWDYPAYPPYYFPPAPGWVVGGAVASGIAWGAGFAIGNAIWDNFDWRHGNINVDIDKNVNIDKHVNRNNVKTGNWEHNPQHRKGVSYNNKQVQNKFGKDAVKSADRKLDYRGRSGEQRPSRQPVARAPCRRASRPVEIVVHHGEHRRRRRKRLDARVLILLRKRFVELVALERFIGLRPAVSLHNFQRVGRRHQYLGEQRVGIECDRRHQGVELALAEALLLGRCGVGAGGLAFGQDRR